MKTIFKLGNKVKAQLTARADAREGLGFDGTFKVECFGKDGKLKWVEPIHNLFTNEGLDHCLDVIFSDGAQDATHYIGLKGAGSEAAGDTMASHAGWAEITVYSEGTRQIWVEPGVSGQSITNTASPAAFSINGSGTVAGAFLTNDNTKGGSAGKLYSVGDFAASRTVADGDTLNVTYQIDGSDV